MKKGLDEIQEIKKDIDEEKSLPLKIGISTAAAVVVGAAAWFGAKDVRITAVGALGSLALAFFFQK